MKRFIVPLFIFLVIGLLAAVYVMPLPCGGRTEDGGFWDGTCMYGPMLIKNLQRGNFFLPFVER